MKNINLQSIKWESVRSIFNIIAEKDTVSRADLSHATGLSLVTVGKVADALLSLDIVLQAKETRSNAGRRAGLLSINHGNYAVILDLISRSFTAVVLDLRYHVLEKIPYTYNENISYRENLLAFFNEVSMAVTNGYELENCYGIGISLPGAYDQVTDTASSRAFPELAEVKLRETLDMYFGGLPLSIDSGVSAAARSNILQVEDYEEKNILYWFIGKTRSFGALVIKGEVSPGLNNRFCDFSSVRDVYGKTLSEKLATAETSLEFAKILSLDTANLIRILAPHTIVIESNRFGCCCDTSEDREPNDLISALVENLKSEHGFTDDGLPEFLQTGHIISHAHRGIAMKLREMWIRRIVENT